MATLGHAAEDQAERDRKREAKEEEERKEREDGDGEQFIRHALHRLDTTCLVPRMKDSATTLLNNLKESQRAVLLNHFQQASRNALQWTTTEWAKQLTFENDMPYIELFAIIMALKGQAIDNLYALVTVLEAANTVEEDKP